MGWKNWAYWIKGVIITLIIILVLFLFSPWNPVFWGILFFSYLILSLPINLFFSPPFECFNLSGEGYCPTWYSIFIIIELIIIGIFFSWLYKKIKKI